jgi:hypothetical protein
VGGSNRSIIKMLAILTATGFFRTARICAGEGVNFPPSPALRSHRLGLIVGVGLAAAPGRKRDLSEPMTIGCHEEKNPTLFTVLLRDMMARKVNRPFLGVYI